MAAYLGALDQGTTSTRFIVFDRGGRIVSIAQEEHEQIYPSPGWVEHDPEEIWRRTQDVIRRALEQKILKPSDLAAIGITNQRETTILWNKSTGQAISNAIVWQDTRVEGMVADFSKNGGPDRFRAKTGLPLSTYFSALKVRWLLENVKDARKQADQGELLFGTVDTFLLWHLTGGKNGGVHLTDVTNASRTQLMNLATLDWGPEILAAFDVPRSILPRIVSSTALYGQTCFRPGEAKNTYGTGCFMLMNTGERAVPSTCGLLTTVGYKLGTQPAIYALEGSVAITGALVQWMRDNLGLIQKSSDIESLARTARDNGGIYFVPAFSGLYAPYWRTDARGVIAGLTRFAGKGHFARAALEATAYQTREVLEAMEKDSEIHLFSLRTDGGR